ncbi:unnamed protein product [Urochloa humidicola]
MEKLKSEHGDSAATGDDGAAPSPSPDRSQADSGSLGDASSSRATAPPHPSGPIAATSAAAFDELATINPDAIWSLVLAKFGRGRRGGGADFAARAFDNPASGADFAARAFVNPASGADFPARAFVNPANGAGMVSGPGLVPPREVEKPECDPSDSAAAAADDAPPSPTPTPSLRKRLCIDSRTARTAPTSCSTPPPRLPELHAARAAAGSELAEKKTGEAGESAATAARDNLPSPTLPPTPRRAVGGTIGSASLGAASSSHASAHLSEQYAASARTFIKPSLLSITGKDPSLPQLHCHGGIGINQEQGNC